MMNPAFLLEIPARQRIPRRRRPPPAPPRSTPVAEVLSELLQRYNRSAHSVAINGGINPSYLSRALRGERATLSRAILEAAARSLECTERDTWRLLAAAGYLPADGWDDSVLADVAAILTDPRLEEAAVDAFRAAVRSLVLAWQRVGELADHVGGHSP